MKYTKNDIQIFIPTYNRPGFLRQALESALNQNAGPLDITVLDNSTNNETEKLCLKYGDCLKYVHSSLPGANMPRLQETASKEFIALLHDDDLWHPDFIRTCLDALNAKNDISIILSNPTTFFDTNEIKFSDRLQREGYYLNSPESFAASFWTNIGGMWTGSVYKNEAFKKINFAELNKKYGKISDVIMLNEMFKDAAFILKDRQAVFYRRHKEQDLHNDATAIKSEQLLNYIKFYRKFFMKEKSLKEIWTLRAGTHIKSNYECMLNNESKKQYPAWESFAGMLMKEDLLDGKTIFYAKRRKNLFYRFVTFPLSLYYRNNYFSEKLITF